MGYTTPPAVSVGAIHTATEWNTYVKDNLRYLKGTDGAVTIDHNMLIGPTAATTNASIELGANSSGDRAALLDFHAEDATYPDYALRVIRNGGAHGATQ